MQYLGYALAGIYLIACIVIINIPLKKLEKNNNSGKITGKTKIAFKTLSITVFGVFTNLLFIFYLITYEYTQQLCLLSICMIIAGICLKLSSKFKAITTQLIFFSTMLFATTLIALLLRHSALNGGVL
ncbi:hypothetical protein [Flexistipes sp.]|uniref:hypothetical protein n=1 Tax=Flexistipes sp. TaxID=3088135 RepID=UPI002E22C580|nr:hypothetical protein [Flexistipes sp.]